MIFPSARSFVPVACTNPRWLTASEYKFPAASNRAWAARINPVFFTPVPCPSPTSSSSSTRTAGATPPPPCR